MEEGVEGVRDVGGEEENGGACGEWLVGGLGGGMGEVGVFWGEAYRGRARGRYPVCWGPW